MIGDLVCPFCGAHYLPVQKGLSCCTNCLNKTNIVVSRKNDISQDLLNKASNYVMHNDMLGNDVFLGSDEEYEVAKQVNDLMLHISPEEVEAWYPRTFAQKIDKVLLYLGSNTKYFGQEFISNNSGEIKKLFFINDLGLTSDTGKELNYFVNYLFEEKYLEGKRIDRFVTGNKGVHCNLTLTPKALARVDELQKNINNNKDIFVAMAFNPNTNSIREAIRAGIKGAKFSEKFLDEIIHNQQIVPYMMRLIRDCRFLIMDITEPNYGAYYEAGYALGLGKEVIITCRKEVFNKTDKDFVCEHDPFCKLKKIANKPHFDIVQRQILVWENEEDLSAKLKQWILELATRKN